MGSGQHKGAMLRTLLHKTKFSPQAIVFVDDHERHCMRMHDAFESTTIDLVTFRYSREDENVRRFQNNDMTHVIEAWKKLKSVTDEIFQ